MKAMNFCPRCGTRFEDETGICSNCEYGKVKEVAPRVSAKDHLIYGLNVAAAKTKIFLAPLALYVVFLLIMVVFLGSTLGIISQESAVLTRGVYIGFFILLLYLAVASTPFLYKTYLDAVDGKDISFRESFKYAKTRVIDYLLADLVRGLEARFLLSSASPREQAAASRRLSEPPARGRENSVQGSQGSLSQADTDPREGLLPHALAPACGLPRRGVVGTEQTQDSRGRSQAGSEGQQGARAQGVREAPQARPSGRQAAPGDR